MAPRCGAVAPCGQRWQGLGSDTVSRGGSKRPPASVASTITAELPEKGQPKCEFITTVYAEVRGQVFLHHLFLRNGLRQKHPPLPVGLVLLEKQT